MHGLSVAIYDQQGQALRGPNRTLYDLRFSSSLPGGFGRCALQVDGSARSLPLAAGQTLAVLLSGAVCWWGWIEDVQIAQQGGAERAAVLALGPWQQLQQRLVNQSWSNVTSTYILRDVLAAYCPDISQDYSQLSNSGVALTRSFVYETAARVVEEVCAGGDASQRPLLFAIWEPPGSRTRIGATGNLVRDSEMEQEETHWERNTDGIFYVTSHVVSPRYAWRFTEKVTGGLWQKQRFAVAASSSYVVDYWVYWTAYSGMSSEIRCDWYNAFNSYLSSSYAGALVSDGSTTGWQYGRGVVTAPGGAVECRLLIGGAVGSGGGSSRYYVVDDVRMYLDATNTAADTRPRAHLWSRDLSDYDYTLRTADVAAGVQTTETTRDLANAVLAKYGSSSFTAFAEDTVSQALYRRRDHLVQAGQVALADAQAQRDVYLGQHAWPGVEMSGFEVRRPGAVRTKRGLAVHPARLRAGDRLLIQDGRLAGTVIMLAEVSWANGVATCRPESYEDVTRVLARV